MAAFDDAPSERTTAALELLSSACAGVMRANGTDAWHALQVLCPDAASGAAEILDQKVVTRVVARTSRREYFLVEGSGASRTAHTVLPGFCTCQNYCQHVAMRPDSLACKHEVAVLLATALSLTQQRDLDDLDWAREFDAALSVPILTAYPAPTAVATAAAAAAAASAGATAAAAAALGNPAPVSYLEQFPPENEPYVAQAR